MHKASANPLAKEALERIGTLYVIEAKLRDLDAAGQYPSPGKDRQMFLGDDAFFAGAHQRAGRRAG